METNAKKNGDVYSCLGKFIGDVGHLLSDDLFALGLDADDMAGLIVKERMNELIAFCRVNPELHIISMMPNGSMVNRVSPDAEYFVVGDGDSNPRLVAKDKDVLQGVLKFKYKLLAKEK